MDTFTWKKDSFLNGTGLRLAGLIYSKSYAGTVIIICHGFTGSKEGGGRALAMAEELGTLGYASFLIDFSGCGESEGYFHEITLTGHVNDLQSSVDYCLSLGFQRVVTVGRSFGGSAVICHGSADTRVAGICAWAAPADLTSVFSSFRDRSLDGCGDLVPLTDEKGTIYIHQNFFSDLTNYSVATLTARIAPRPLLLVHGNNDAVVPVKNAYEIFDAAGEPKEIRIMNGGDHQLTGHRRQVWNALFQWLRKHFPL